MSKICSFKDLDAYQKGYSLALRVFELTREYPKEELYGIVAQMRRAAVSVPSNIAEGYRRNSRKEYVQFLSIAHGSCAELETQLSLSFDLGFMDKAAFERIGALQTDVSKLLLMLIRSLS
jgi:four helix bundle protein